MLEAWIIYNKDRVAHSTESMDSSGCEFLSPPPADSIFTFTIIRFRFISKIFYMPHECYYFSGSIWTRCPAARRVPWREGRKVRDGRRERAARGSTHTRRGGAPSLLVAAGFTPMQRWTDRALERSVPLVPGGLGALSNDSLFCRWNL